MEKEAACTYKSIAYESDQEDCIMAVFQTVANALACEVYEQQIREGVDDLRSVRSNDIVLYSFSNIQAQRKWELLLTSSHQSSVDVIGLQYPSCSGG
jgi:hypothetical protein